MTLTTSLASGTVPASASAVFSGPIAAGDVIKMHMVNLAGLTYNDSYTVQASDSAQTAIAAFITALEDDGNLSNDYMVNPATGGFEIVAYSPSAGYNFANNWSVTVATMSLPRSSAS